MKIATTRLLGSLCPLLLLATSCSPDAGNSATPSRAGNRHQLRLVDDCRGLTGVRATEISFISGGKLFLARRHSSTARCAVEVAQATGLEWGPEADRLLTGDLTRYEGRRVAGWQGEVGSPAWSRPTGTSVVFVSPSEESAQGRLLKLGALGSEAADISFLADHDEVVYHPAGTHVAVTGTAEDGVYGLWLATNLGEEAQLLAIGEDARRIFSLSFSPDGRKVYYAAEHDDHFDVHGLQLASEDEKGRLRDAKLSTIDTASTVMGDVVATPFGDSVAYTVGTCAEKTTRVWNGEIVEPGAEVAGLSTEPLGWMPSGELLLLARDDGCEGPGTLYAWQPRSEHAVRLAVGVEAAAPRASLPPPPPPPDSQQQVVA
jgi:hypothetical protein